MSPRPVAAGRRTRRVGDVILRVLQRLGILVVSLLVSSVLVFAFMAVLPGDPARVALGVNASDEAVAQLREQFGLDRPLVVQYLDWLGGLLTFRLGNSYVSGAAIGPQVADRLQVTLWLVVTATVIATLIAIPPGRAGGGAPPEAVRAGHLGGLPGRRRRAGVPGRHPAHHRLRGAARLAAGERLDAAGRRTR